MSNIAIILAGGSGKRIGATVPKQFIEVAGKSVVEYTIDAFERNKGIDEIAIVCRQDYVEMLKKNVGQKYRKVRKILPGGEERYHSSLSAIAAYTNNDDTLFFHDAVRPLVSDDLINRCVEASLKYDAVAVAVPATDTIMRVDADGCLAEIPSRHMLRCAQTPQCFRRGLITQAYEKALRDPGFNTTDDCGVVLRYMPDVKIKIIEGDVNNVKITYKEDLVRLEQFLQQE